MHKPSLTPITSCRRVVMVETMLIPPFSEASVPAKVEIKPGEHGLCAIGPAKRYGGKNRRASEEYSCLTSSGRSPCPRDQSYRNT